MKRFGQIVATLMVLALWIHSSALIIQKTAPIASTGSSEGIAGVGCGLLMTLGAGLIILCIWVDIELRYKEENYETRR